MPRNKTTRSLPVPLTNEEHRVKTAELTKVMMAKRVKNEEIKTVRAAQKKELDSLQFEESRLADIVHHKRELREVDCTWRGDYSRKVWFLYRDDTGEEIEMDTMTKSDLQEEFDLISDNVAQPEEVHDNHDPETGEVFNDQN